MKVILLAEKEMLFLVLLYFHDQNYPNQNCQLTFADPQQQINERNPVALRINKKVKQIFMML